jgi:hypothetical protein
VAVDGGELTLSSRPLDADRLVVSLRWSGDTSSWRFAYLGETREREGWQDITGSVALNGGREQLDDREQFARALAARAGWSDGPKLPSATEPAPTGPPAEAGEKEPRWRARTDVWGRPLDVQGR